MTMPMGVRSVLENCRDVLKDSESIKEYCQENWSKDQTVYLGTNPQNPATQEKYPALVIAAVKVVERTSRTIKYSVGIGVCVVGDNEPLVDGNSTTYEGFIQAEELKELVELEIISSGKFVKVTLDSENLPNEVFPIFSTMTFLMIEELVSSRSA